MSARWLLLLTLVLAGCRTVGGDPHESHDSDASFEYGTSRAGMFTAAWRPVGGTVPENELFEIEVLLYEGQDLALPMTGAQVLISAWMPDHGHGMNRQPRAVEVEPGRYSIRGVLFHMGGYWQLFVDVIRDGVSERAQFEITIG